MASDDRRLLMTFGAKGGVARFWGVGGGLLGPTTRAHFSRLMTETEVDDRRRSSTCPYRLKRSKVSSAKRRGNACALIEVNSTQNDFLVCTKCTLHVQCSFGFVEYEFPKTLCHDGRETLELKGGEEIGGDERLAAGAWNDDEGGLQRFRRNK